MDIIYGRTLGEGYPVSIATSLALERLAGKHPEISDPRPPLLDYHHLMVNLKTLYRNIMGAIPSGERHSVKAEAVASVLWTEVGCIHAAMMEVKPSIKLHFYTSNYKDMARAYPHATIREDTTPNQKESTALMVKAVNLFLERWKKEGPPVPNIKLSVMERKVEGAEQGKTIILTSYAYDLVAYKSFESLSLIESHTGAIKDRALWHTKYLNGKELVRIPFREDLLQVFGDSNHFAPWKADVRRAILEIAEKYNWTAMTTTDKIRMNLGELKNEYAKKVLMSIITKQ